MVTSASQGADEDSSSEERRAPAVERVLDHILNELDARQLKPGGRVNAARIAATLSLSVAPVREALSVTWSNFGK